MKKRRVQTNAVAVSDGLAERWVRPGKIFGSLDQDQAIDEADYRSLLRRQQARLIRLHLDMARHERPAVVVIEGPDAAGKGGTIKRLVEGLDPRRVRTWLIGKPTAEDAAHHYLRRFWIRLPSRSTLAIFDRSWYGRVLVERVEGFATVAQWRRAYREINEFERMLVEDGTVLVKVWIHVSRDEQLFRFRRRKADPLKAWKIGAEDWRNRRRWKAHNRAAEEMLEHTSTAVAPWHVVPGDFKWYARVETLRVVAEALGSAKSDAR